jgi:hypothetical protein
MPRRVPKVPKAEEEPTPPAEGNAGEGEEAPPASEAPPPEDLKVVILLREGRGSIGVQRAGCDPFLLPLPDAGLTNAVARLPDALVEADARWREQRQYPKYTRPAPPPRAPAPPRAARTPPARPVAPAVQAPRMF